MLTVLADSVGVERENRSAGESALSTHYPLFSKSPVIKTPRRQFRPCTIGDDLGHSHRTPDQHLLDPAG